MGHKYGLQMGYDGSLKVHGYLEVGPNRTHLNARLTDF